MDYSPHGLSAIAFPWLAAVILAADLAGWHRSLQNCRFGRLTNAFSKMGEQRELMFTLADRLDSTEVKLRSRSQINDFIFPEIAEFATFPADRSQSTPPLSDRS